MRIYLWSIYGLSTGIFRDLLHRVADATNEANGRSEQVLPFLFVLCELAEEF